MYLKKRCHESQKLCAFAFACPAVASHPLRLREISSLVNALNKTANALGLARLLAVGLRRGKGIWVQYKKRPFCHQIGIAFASCWQRIQASQSNNRLLNALFEVFFILHFALFIPKITDLGIDRLGVAFWSSPS
jgi:hypothetical protein